MATTTHIIARGDTSFVASGVPTGSIPGARPTRVQLEQFGIRPTPYAPTPTTLE